MLLGDGASLTNPPLISLLQRRVTRILVCLNIGDALPTRAEWDPRASPPPESFSDDLPPFFGVRTRETPAKWTERNQVFPTEDFAPLVAKLQESDASGSGAVARTTLTTVVNGWWGVPAGLQVEVVWVYLTRALRWEARLPAPVRESLPQPGGAAGLQASRAGAIELIGSALANARVPASNSRLVGFPQYPLSRLELPPVQAAALHQLCGWTLLEHRAMLLDALGGFAPTEPPPTEPAIGLEAGNQNKPEHGKNI